MKAKCKNCKHCYYGDDTSVIGFRCEKNQVLLITDIEEIHSFCPGYELSLFAYLFKINE